MTRDLQARQAELLLSLQLEQAALPPETHHIARTDDQSRDSRYGQPITPAQAAEHLDVLNQAVRAWARDHPDWTRHMPADWAEKSA